jgi:ankyrin repeat protein
MEVQIPLHDAALDGEVTEMRRLVAAGAIVDERDADGDTALHCASMNGHVEAMRALVELGANKDAKGLGRRFTGAQEGALGGDQVVSAARCEQGRED